MVDMLILLKGKVQLAFIQKIKEIAYLSPEESIQYRL